MNALLKNLRKLLWITPKKRGRNNYKSMSEKKQDVFSGLMDDVLNYYQLKKSRSKGAMRNLDFHTVEKLKPKSKDNAMIDLK